METRTSHRRNRDRRLFKRYDNFFTHHQKTWILKKLTWGQPVGVGDTDRRVLETERRSHEQNEERYE
ncbi:MAG: hypothetical protein HQM13_00790 [SAR324 cluster bacterium]|nr:hypothetical protein [SAR324 cluster bacterium]